MSIQGVAVERLRGGTPTSRFHNEYRIDVCTSSRSAKPTRSVELSWNISLLPVSLLAKKSFVRNHPSSLMHRLKESCNRYRDLLILLNHWFSLKKSAILLSFRHVLSPSKDMWYVLCASISHGKTFNRVEDKWSVRDNIIIMVPLILWTWDPTVNDCLLDT